MELCGSLKLCEADQRQFSLPCALGRLWFEHWNALFTRIRENMSTLFLTGDSRDLAQSRSTNAECPRLRRGTLGHQGRGAGVGRARGNGVRLTAAKMFTRPQP
jgi:hypothetical protein